MDPANTPQLHDVIGNVILAGYGWRARLAARSPRAFRNAVNGTVNYLRDPATPGNQVEEGEPSLADRFRNESSRLARFYALCSTRGELHAYRDDIAFFEEVRVWMVKFDAEDRRARGLSVPADVEVYLRRGCPRGGSTSRQAFASQARTIRESVACSPTPACRRYTTVATSYYS